MGKCLSRPSPAQSVLIEDPVILGRRIIFYMLAMSDRIRVRLFTKQVKFLLDTGRTVLRCNDRCKLKNICLEEDWSFAIDSQSVSDTESFFESLMSEPSFAVEKLQIDLNQCHTQLVSMILDILESCPIRLKIKELTLLCSGPQNIARRYLTMCDPIYLEKFSLNGVVYDKETIVELIEVQKVPMNHQQASLSTELGEPESTLQCPQCDSMDSETTGEEKEA